MKAMNVLLRADAGETQGTGHVMRCMTLAEALVARGHTVTLMGNFGVVPWLGDTIAESGIELIPCDVDALDIEQIGALGMDWVVVDSYTVPSELVSRLNLSIPCLAIVDGDARSISAALYLDQNLGTTLEADEVLGERLLAGNHYVLVRDAILEHRHSYEITNVARRLRVVGFMGGTDPNGAIIEVAKSVAAQQLDIELDLVATSAWASRAEAAVAGMSRVRIVAPTRDLPSILGRADIVVSAAGTSAWDVCTMARAGIFIALVDNQQASLAAITDAGVALTLDATGESAGVISQVGRLVASLVGDRELRQTLTRRCWDTFDGLGKTRVVETMERMLRP